MTKKVFESVDGETGPFHLVDARTVAKIGVSFLVEYVSNGEPFRVILPEPVSGPVPLESVELGVPYGVDWKSVIVPANVKSADFARELRKRDIWTAADVMSRPGEVLSAIQSVYGVDLSAIIVAATKNQEV